jgi:hypothetical protein
MSVWHHGHDLAGVSFFRFYEHFADDPLENYISYKVICRYGVMGVKIFPSEPLSATVSSTRLELAH